MSSNQNRCYLTRPEAAERARERGIPLTPNRLAKYAVTGGGPPYHNAFGRSLLGEDTFDDWLENKLGEPKTTTCERETG